MPCVLHLQASEATKAEDERDASEARQSQITTQLPFGWMCFAIGSFGAGGSLST